ncbi:MAG: peptide chain release factor N(5)-glutamine methyltransferase [Propionibacteriaceae bacterium]|nr:peptide chain release factor N(5)-glutamine methyltransferase [Micropruina sp.]HBX81542.1 peptide chain release factor N(5)-glutamine methyltransferase [Propionibacteriaceae bacterium]HBY24511.1 peptide chain release factor N(5)-glutamine methyltransferase [Propionibacteriaceae bacterium]
MSSASDLLRWGSAELGSPPEARTLLAHATGVPVAGLLVLPSVDPAAEATYRTLVARRAAGEPVQYLTGVAHFRTVELAVGPGVFIPRPETEVLVGWALDCLAAVPGTPRVVELCAGSGAISKAIAVEHPGCEQWAVELSEEAVDFAAINLSRTDVVLTGGDMADAFPELNGTIDLVIANPPYIPLTAYEGVAKDVRENEPAIALFSGDDGLDAMRVVADVAARLLRPGGWVGAEHAEVQEESVVRVFTKGRRFLDVRDHRDLAGRPRYVTARLVG